MGAPAAAGPAALDAPSAGDVWLVLGAAGASDLKRVEILQGSESAGLLAAEELGADCWSVGAGGAAQEGWPCCPLAGSC